MRFVALPRVTKVMQRWLTGITLLAAFSTPVAAQPPGLVVSVAASIHDALAEIAGLYRAATGVTVALNTGSSNTLARQIVEGAPVAVFLSADDVQMDVVEKAGRLAPGTRTRLLTNDLAIIAPQDATSALTVERILEAGISRLGMGETTSVPVGVYGRRWLERQGAWARLAPKVVPFPTPSAVVAAINAGRVDAGIVYRTDAMTASARVIAVISGKDLGVVQHAAVIQGAREADGRRFLDFLKSKAARDVFLRRGFSLP